jgi:hypothetical protein
MDGPGWATVQQGKVAVSEATGVQWYVRERIRIGKHHGAVLRCPQNKTVKCRAKVVLLTGQGNTGFYRVDHDKTRLTHNGHVVAPRAAAAAAAVSVKRPRPDPVPEVQPNGYHRHVDEVVAKRCRLFNVDGHGDEGVPVPLGRPADADEVLAAVEGLDCEELRRLRGGELWGLRLDAYVNPEYYFIPQKYRRPVLKRVTPIQSAEVFGQALREHERPYFHWWSTINGMDAVSPLVYMRIHGASALEVERSLMRLQKRYGCLTRAIFKDSGHRRHAVFTCPLNPTGSALLAINLHALRAYRMLSVNSIDTQTAMPMAPVLLQFFYLEPRSPAEAMSRRFGVLTTLLFIHDALGLGSAPFERHGYGVLEPGFAIYDYLPDFMAMFHETDYVLRLRMYQSFHMRDMDQCQFWNLVAAFVFQKQVHCISNQLVTHLYEEFNDSLHSHRLRHRCPEAWRLIRSAYFRRTGVNWVVLDLDHEKRVWAGGQRGTGGGGGGVPPTLVDEQAPLRMPPAYYLYRLALVEGRDLIRHELRFEICTNLIVQNFYQPLSRFAKPVHYPDVVALHHYQQALLRPSDDPIATRLRMFSSNKSHLAGMGSLFDVLRALDYHRQRAPLPQRDLADLQSLGEMDLEDVDGPLDVFDCSAFALEYSNLPLAYTTLRGKLPDPEAPDLAYLDDTLWVWGCGLSKGPATPVTEAEMLVRDATFYAVY